MKMVPLGEIIRKSGSRAKEDTAYPVYSVTKHGGFVPSEQYFKKQVFSKDLSTYTRVKAGEFAYATIHLDEGSIGIAPVDCLISPMYTVFTVDQNEADPNYLIKQLKSPPAIAQYDRLGNGSVHRRRSIPLSALNQLKVPLPPLDEQRRIAAILDKADAIRQKRRQAIAHLETLTQSIFDEMFTSKAEAKTTLGQIGNWKSGGTPSRKNLNFYNGDLPWFKSGDLGMITPLPPSENISEEALASSAAKLIQPNSVLVGMYDTAAMNSSIVTSFASCNQAVAFAWIDPDLANSAYIYHAIQSVRHQTLSLRRGIRQKNLNLSMIKSIEIPFPERTKQDRFEAICRTAQVLVGRLSATMHYDLFASLQSRAFRGEL